MGTYPENWPEISLRTKEDAGWRCVRCRHPDFSPEERSEVNRCGRRECDGFCRHPKRGKKRVLTVHHLDGEKDNCRWWNLVALCQVCHLYIQARVKVNQGYFFPISPWMRPYVAGGMAFKILGEDLSREEVVGDRLDELLEIWNPVVLEGM